MSRWPLLLALFLCVSAPGLAEAQEQYRFEIAGARLEMQAPKEYCRDKRTPEEAYPTMSKASAIHLVFLRCGFPPHTDSIVISTPNTSLNSRQSRASLLAEIAAVTRDPALKDLVRDSTAALSRRLSERLESRGTFSGGLTALGADDVCGYLGGSFEMVDGDFRVAIAAIACMTVVNDRTLLVIRYVRKDRVGSVETLIPELREIATTIASGS